MIATRETGRARKDARNGNQPKHQPMFIPHSDVNYTHPETGEVIDLPITVEDLEASDDPYGLIHSQVWAEGFEEPAKVLEYGIGEEIVSYVPEYDEWIRNAA